MAKRKEPEMFDGIPVERPAFVVVRLVRMDNIIFPLCEDCVDDLQFLAEELVAGLCCSCCGCPNVMRGVYGPK